MIRLGDPSLHGPLWENRLSGCELASLVSCRTGDKCVLNFKPCGMFGKELHKIEGYIQDKRYTRPPVPSAASFLFYQPPPPPFTPPCLPPLPSKKKHCIIYGKWTECLWSVDPQAYEAHKKLEKKGDKKLKNVRKPLTIIAILNLSHHFCLSFSCWRYRCRILGCLQ